VPWLHLIACGFERERTEVAGDEGAADGVSLGGSLGWNDRGAGPGAERQLGMELEHSVAESGVGLKRVVDFADLWVDRPRLL
jgi:hypothetical protein